MALEPDNAVKRVLHIDGVLKGVEQPEFYAETIGSDHNSTLGALEGEVSATGRAMGETLKSPPSKQGDLYEESLDFSIAYALRRDYRSRYGTTLWHRKKGIKSARQTQFLRGTLKLYSEA